MDCFDIGRHLLKDKFVTLSKRIGLIICGTIFSIIFLETGLRLGGAIFSSLQEQRNRIVAQRKGAYRILCLGESVTAAGGRNSYPSQLSEILQRHNIGIQFSVINKGVIAAGTSFIVNQLEKNLDAYQPDIVIVMAGINDKYIKYYEGISDRESIVFNKFRTYRLIRIMWSHIVNKRRKDSVSRLGSSCARFTDEEIFIESEESLKKQIELNPGNGDAYLRLGWFYKRRRNILQAEEYFRRTIQINPKNDWAYIGLGWVWKKKGSISHAEKYFKQAAELNPKNEWAYLYLGDLYKEEGKFSHAEKYFKQAAELNPKNEWAYLYLVGLYKDEGKLLQAEGSFNKALLINPGNSKIYGGLATVYLAMGRTKLAEEYYKKANELRSKYYSYITVYNYRKIKKILNRRGIRLVCVQYPMYNIGPLKKIFQGQSEGVIFIDNEEVFKKVVAREGYGEYFLDMFGGNFGHCTPKGNRLLAENIAQAILKEGFGKSL